MASSSTGETTAFENQARDIGVHNPPPPPPKRALTVSALSEKILPSARLDDKTDLKNASDSHSETENLLST